MRGISVGALLFAFLLNPTNVQAGDESPPFWKSKPAHRRRMYEERAILVSVRDEKRRSTEGERIRLTVKGAGVVSVPRAYAFAFAQEYERLRQVSSHFKSVTYDPSKRRLSIVAEALGFQVRSVLRMEPVSGAERDEVRWEVVEGDFQGMRGVLAIERADGAGHAESGRAEVSIDSIYEAREIPLPRILMGWTLEAIVQKAAERIRTMAEQEYRLKNAG